MYGHNVSERFILLHQGQNEKSNYALQSYEKPVSLYMQKSGPFHLKYMECGFIYLCKYNWVLHEKQIWIQPAEDFFGDVPGNPEGCIQVA